MNIIMWKRKKQVFKNMKMELGAQKNLWVQSYCTRVFQMLAPPAGETFDGLDEEKLPTKARISDPAPEYVHLFESDVPETAESDSSVRRKEAMIPCILLALGGNLIDGAVANLRGCGKESAAILFWVHIFAVFFMAGWIVLYLAIRS